MVGVFVHFFSLISWAKDVRSLWKACVFQPVISLNDILYRTCPDTVIIHSLDTRSEIVWLLMSWWTLQVGKVATSEHLNCLMARWCNLILLQPVLLCVCFPPSDLPTGSYIQEDLSRCSSLCEAGRDCCDVMASCKCGTHTGQYDCICEKGYYGKGLQHECTGRTDGRMPGSCHFSPGSSQLYQKTLTPISFLLTVTILKVFLSIYLLLAESSDVMVWNKWVRQHLRKEKILSVNHSYNITSYFVPNTHKHWFMKFNKEDGGLCMCVRGGAGRLLCIWDKWAQNACNLWKCKFTHVISMYQSDSHLLTKSLTAVSICKATTVLW